MLRMSSNAGAAVLQDSPNFQYMYLVSPWLSSGSLLALFCLWSICHTVCTIIILLLTCTWVAVYAGLQSMLGSCFVAWLSDLR